MARDISAKILGAVLLTALTGATIHADPGRPFRVVTVQIQGQRSVAPATLFGACADATRLYRDVGVDLVWVTSDPQLRIVFCDERDACASNATRLAMGQAVIDSTTRMGSVAYVYHDRVDDLAAGSRVDPASILGHVMAHEIAHLLGVSHAKSGLMRAGWNTVDVMLAADGLLDFSPADRAVMQKSVARLREGAPAFR